MNGDVNQERNNALRRADYENWEAGLRVPYGGYLIVPRYDLSGLETSHAWRVTTHDAEEESVLPGNPVAGTIEIAQFYIDVYLAAGEHGTRFRHLLNAFHRWTAMNEHMVTGMRLP